MLKRLFCKHDFEFVDSVVVGACMTWSGSVSRQFTSTYKCSKCGKNDVRTGLYNPADQRMYPHLYDDKGWPLDDRGNRLPIADEP